MHNTLLKVKLQNLPLTALYIPSKSTVKHLLPMTVRSKTSKHVKMKESENITQTEENPKAGSAIHSQDGFKNQTEERREDKSFSFGAPQTSTTVPDHETQVA